ncbi:MAG: 4-hydroxy-tetrahydrodipicolinate reductase [Fimbriimonadaceae bacterium]|nr:4-hydroxy-tetrahydrodipicolinate reductase [Fimbriimonadaceae bacterium]
MSVRVCVAGAAGRMGMESVKALAQADGIEVVAAVDRVRIGETAYPGAPALSADLGAGLADATVLLDFTHPEVAADNASLALSRGVAVVIGTSGVSRDQLDRLRVQAEEAQTPVLVVPNFAIGAVLMMQFAALAAKWMPSAEVIEMHHDQKLDAPSGTATRTAEIIASSRNQAPAVKEGTIMKVACARGGMVESVPVHSVRLPGLVAHQMILFGGPGETLTIRHDSLDRTSFMPGVVLAVRRVWELEGLRIGLDTVM